MIAGDVVLVRLPQLTGPTKLRPALVLATLPGAFQTILLCGISTRLQNLEPDWDELLDANAADVANSGLHRASTIRLSYLYAGDGRDTVGVIGQIDPTRLDRLRKRLSGWLQT
jgi:mRNA interferase MazF